MKLLQILHMMNWLKKLMPLILVDFSKKKDYDNKITEIEGKIPNITSLATTSVKSKVPNDCDLVKRVQYDVKISDIHFASSDYNKLMNGILDEKIKNK